MPHAFTASGTDLANMTRNSLRVIQIKIYVISDKQTNSVTDDYQEVERLRLLKYF
ncbi:hypothetical protein ACP8HZ_03495 [Francisella noatunensis]